jgi:hypothetical protein
VKKIRANAKGDCGGKKNSCGQVTRELVPGTLQLFYMKGYGAVEWGVHLFHPRGTKAEKRSSRASSSTSGGLKREPGRLPGSLATATVPSSPGEVGSRFAAAIAIECVI